MVKSDPNRPLQKVTMNFFADSYADMHALYPVIGAAVAIRLIIDAHVRKIKDEAAKGVAPAPEIDLDIQPELL